MAVDGDRTSGTTKRDVFVIFTATCATLALVFAIANFFVAADARDTAESAETTAEQALAAARGAPQPAPSPTTTTLPPGVSAVGVTLTEYTVTLDPSVPLAGPTAFRIVNDGKVAHEFVLFRTALAADALPLKKNGDVNEDARQLDTVADSGSDLAPGAHRTVRATLTPGHYVALCNLPGHYAAGMHTEFTVS
jgi:uncharacterized cupredoxin-like copper-binding protein